MVKILLVVEDYSEQTFLHTLMMKLGFSIDSVNKQNMISSRIVSFRPDLIISTAKGRKVNGLKIVLDFRKKFKNIKYIFIKHKGQDFVDKLVMDGIVSGALEVPIDVRSLIQNVCSALNIEEQDYLEKYNKIMSRKEKGLEKITSASDFSSEDEDNIFVKSNQTSEADGSQGMVSSSGPGQDSQFQARGAFRDEDYGYQSQEGEKQSRYDKYLKGVMLPEQIVLDRSQIKKAIKSVSVLSEEDEQDLLDLKRKYVDELFKKKKSD